MPEGPLPITGVGTREGEAFTRHGRRSDLQGFGILQHRLSERIIQSGCQKGICAESIRRQRQTLKNRAAKNLFVWRGEDSREEVRKRTRLTLQQQPREFALTRDRIRDFESRVLSPLAIFAAAR